MLDLGDAVEGILQLNLETCSVRLSEMSEGVQEPCLHLEKSKENAYHNEPFRFRESWY